MANIVEAKKNCYQSLMSKGLYILFTTLPNSCQHPLINYLNSGRHNIRKYPGHLAPNQQDNFENPYARKQPSYPQRPQRPQPPPVEYPQYPQGYPQYPMQPNYGKKRRRKRKKRDTGSQSQTTEDYDTHWGIHRIMSTGIFSKY